MAFQPTPTTSRPHLHDQATLRATLPHTCIERDRLVPGARRNGRTLRKLFPLSLCFFFTRSPLLEMCVEGASRPQRSVNSSAPEHGRDIFTNRGERHDRVWVALCRMSELF